MSDRYSFKERHLRMRGRTSTPNRYARPKTAADSRVRVHTGRFEDRLVLLQAIALRPDWRRRVPARRHIWWLNQRIEEIEPAEIKRRAATPEAAKGIAYIQKSLNEALRAQKAFFAE